MTAPGLPSTPLFAPSPLFVPRISTPHPCPVLALGINSRDGLEVPIPGPWHFVSPQLMFWQRGSPLLASAPGSSPLRAAGGEAAGAGSVPPATRRPSAGYGAAGRAGRRPLEGRRYRWKGGDTGLGAGREEKWRGAEGGGALPAPAPQRRGCV